MFVWCDVVFYCVSVVRDCVCMVLDGAIMCYMVFLCSVLCYRAILCFIILSCVLGAKHTHTHVANLSALLKISLWLYSRE